MKDNLPNVYANPINKDLSNAQSVFYSKDEDVRGSVLEVRDDNVSVETKINRIFNSPNFVYKSKVEIETDRGVLNTTVVGMNNNSIITMDNQNIPISSIKDIRNI